MGPTRFGTKKTRLLEVSRQSFDTIQLASEFCREKRGRYSAGGLPCNCCVLDKDKSNPNSMSSLSVFDWIVFTSQSKGADNCKHMYKMGDVFQERGSPFICCGGMLILFSNRAKWFLIFATEKGYFRMTVPSFHTLLQMNTVKVATEDLNLQYHIRTFYSKKHELTKISDVSQGSDRHNFIKVEPIANVDVVENDNDCNHGGDDDEIGSNSSTAKRTSNLDTTKKRKRDQCDSESEVLQGMLNKELAEVKRQLGALSEVKELKTRLEDVLDCQRRHMKSTDTELTELSKLMRTATSKRVSPPVDVSGMTCLAVRISLCIHNPLCMQY